jgi:hypothetical protein
VLDPVHTVDDIKINGHDVPSSSIPPDPRSGNGLKDGADAAVLLEHLIPAWPVLQRQQLGGEMLGGDLPVSTPGSPARGPPRTARRCGVRDALYIE